MELRHFRYFIAVAEELNFSKAAERLNIAQPPLSQQIMNLEGEIGVRLLERTKRTVRLTEAGTTFLEHAYKTVADAEAAMLSARKAGRGEIGRISVAFVASTAFAFLPEVIRSFSADYPEAELDLKDLTSAEQRSAFEKGTIDIGFLRPPIGLPGLESVVVVREPFIVALPSDHVLAGLERVPLEALRDESFIAISHELAPGLYAQTQQILGRAGIDPRIMQEVGQLDIAIAFAAAGLGVSILPSSIAAFHHDRVVYKPLAKGSDVAETVAVWRRDNESPLLRNFIEVVRTVSAFG
jgi:DNA-binding transcriptional LysR family regulator